MSSNHRKRARWTKGRRVRDREAEDSNPSPPTKNRIQIEVFALLGLTCGVTGKSQIFLELGGGSPVQVDFSNRQCPRRCAADAQDREARASESRTSYIQIGSGSRIHVDQDPIMPRIMAGI